MGKGIFFDRINGIDRITADPDWLIDREKSKNSDPRYNPVEFDGIKKRRDADGKSANQAA